MPLADGVTNKNGSRQSTVHIAQRAVLIWHAPANHGATLAACLLAPDVAAPPPLCARYVDATPATRFAFADVLQRYAVPFIFATLSPAVIR